MAGEWLKMRGGLLNDPVTWGIAKTIGVPAHMVICNLYILADWFERSGKQGKMEIDNRGIDLFVGELDFAGALEDCGWLKSNGKIRFLSGFCIANKPRKSLGRAIRQELLSGATCRACGTSDGLCIDHIIPVVRGGSCDVKNLQPLCFRCNARKGRKTMAEFMAGEPA